jgi:hypothetical protein
MICQSALQNQNAVLALDIQMQLQGMDEHTERKFYKHFYRQ